MEKRNRKYPKSKEVVMELFDNPVGWFDCITDAARKLGYTKDTITNRINKGLVINGVRVRFPKEGEDYTNLPNLSPLKAHGQCIRPKSDKNKRLKVEKPKEVKKEVVHKELDREKYNIIQYEVRNILECITPCPYMLSPKIMVGSVKCQKCPSFKGKNPSTHEVACNRCHYE